LVDVFPSGAIPGGTVVVRTEEFDGVTEKSDVSVTVGEQPAHVIRVVPEIGVEFLVPRLEPGLAAVEIAVDGSPAGATTLKIVGSPARQLVLTMTGDSIELVSDQGASSLGRPSREIPARKALGYDVVTGEDRILATGTIPHPLSGRLEVHEADGTLHGSSTRSSETFFLRIPAVPQGSRVRFFEFEEGVGALTAGSLNQDARDRRKLISEIELGGGS